MDAALYYRKQEVFNKTNLLAALNFTICFDQRYFTGAQNFREIEQYDYGFHRIACLLPSVRTALVRNTARSEPAPGSLNSWHQYTWPVACQE